MHGQRAYVAAREFQWLYGEPIGGEHDFTAVQCQRHRVRLDIEVRVGQVAREDVVNQLAHEAAAVTVCKRDV